MPSGIKENNFFGTFTLSLSGTHNILNSLAAIATAHFLGLSATEIQQGLSSYKNVKKRLEIRAIINDIIIYDDFAHHPTAVQMTIEGLRNRFPDRKIWAVFEPRTSTAKRKIKSQWRLTD